MVYSFLLWMPIYTQNKMQMFVNLITFQPVILFFAYEIEMIFLVV